MQTSAHTNTVQCHASNAPSQALSTWILGARILLRRKGKVSLTTKRNTESIEIEKRLKKGIAGDFLRAGEEMLFVNSKVSWSQNSLFQLRLNQAKRCCSSTASHHDDETSAQRSFIAEFLLAQACSTMPCISTSIKVLLLFMWLANHITIIVKHSITTYCTLWYAIRHLKYSQVTKLHNLIGSRSHDQ